MSRVHELPVSGEKVNASQTEHVARMEGTLARVYRRNGYEAATERSPLSDLLSKEAGADPQNVIADTRAETLVGMLRYIYGEGPEPWFALRRLYALARAVDPELIAQMNGTDLAEMFDETRSNQSARAKKMFVRLLEKNGGKGAKLAFQKPHSARQKMAKAQMGNQNRKGQKIARLAKASSGKYHN